MFNFGYAHFSNANFEGFLIMDGLHGGCGRHDCDCIWISSEDSAGRSNMNDETPFFMLLG